MIIKIIAYPDYWKGHSFFWEIPSNENPVMPLTFNVERSIDPGGDNSEWEDISGPIVNNFSWQANYFPEQDRKSRYCYRIHMVDASGDESYSVGTTLYGDLGRTDYCIMRTIMRNEVIDMRIRSGVPMHLYVEDPRGGKCTECVDAVTGSVMDPNCQVCHGTGLASGFYGPVRMYGLYTGDNSSKDFSHGQVLNIKDPAYFTIRIIGSPMIREDDSFFVDLHNNKRYEVYNIESVVEIRRIPVIQHVKAKEIAKDDIRYDVGSGGGAGPCPTTP